MLTPQQCGQIFFVLERCNRIERRFQRRCAQLLHFCLIHAGGKVVADLLLRGIAAAGLLRQFVKNAPEKPLIINRKLAINAPGRLIRRDGIVFHPAATGVLIKIHARIG